MTTATTLILFDIDGTLALTGGAGGRAMSRAFEDLFGIANAFARMPMAGRTDSWLLRQALDAHGIPADDPRAGAFPDTYFNHLRDQLRQPPAPGARYGVLPGVRALLDALADRQHAYVALLTGNYERGARLKLEHFDLWRYFACGAFGDGAPDRNGLLPRALARVLERGGPAVAPRDTVVIGDTPLDVVVAIAGGARSIAVATGSHSAEELRASGADAVFEDLSDTGEVLRALRIADEPQSAH